MEAIKNRLKTIAWFLTALMLFQSCVVYHKTPTTLEKASQEQIKTKVTTTDGEVTKYKYITYEEGVYYGYVEVEYGEFTKIPLDAEEIINIRTKNKSASTTWTAIIAITIPLIAIAVIAASSELNSGL